MTIRVGVSSCLLGHAVRYDGGHKRSEFLTGQLGQFVDFVPVCPEVEIGLGTPRPTITIQKQDGEARLIMPRTGEDLTSRMLGYAERRVAALERQALSGYVLKKKSPSCDPRAGMFAQVLQRRLPLLPVEDEGRLQDPALRENFIERVFAYHRLRELFGRRWTAKDVVAFHTIHKLTLLSHSTTAYQRLGRLVARVAAMDRDGFRAEYERGFMQALARVATTGRHTNVLQHMAGYFRERLSDEDREELAEVIEDYRLGRVPLIVPITLIRHHVRAQRITYLADQVYLRPHPRELMLRNHV